MSIGPLLFSFFQNTDKPDCVPQTSIEPTDYAYLFTLYKLFIFGPVIVCDLFRIMVDF